MINHQELLREAYKYASEFSTDPSTQNGALLVNLSGEILVRAANHFPKGVNQTAERWERPLKYKYVEHAERNAIYEAARRGVATEGLIMVCPWAACSDCARGIVQAGIKELIVHKKMMNENTSEKWEDEIRVARTILMEAGVKYKICDTNFVYGPEIRFNGQRFQP